MSQGWTCSCPLCRCAAVRKSRLARQSRRCGKLLPTDFEWGIFACIESIAMLPSPIPMRLRQICNKGPAKSICSSNPTIHFKPSGPSDTNLWRQSNITQLRSKKLSLICNSRVGPNHAFPTIIITFISDSQMSQVRAPFELSSSAPPHASSPSCILHRTHCHSLLIRRRARARCCCCTATAPS